MIPGSANPLLLATAAPTGYTIERSLRFNSADSAYLSRTPASAGNRKTWTWAGWVKRSTLGSGDQLIFACRQTSTPYTLFYFRTAGQITYVESTGSIQGYITTEAVYRDPSAWMHIVLTADYSNAVSTDRIRIYVNGTRQVIGSTVNTPVYPLTTNDSYVNSATQHQIGAQVATSPTEFFNGYLADIHFIDGQALDPTSFGEFDVNNVWQPKAFSGGSYGTNGFKLNFSNNSAATAAALGADSSGNGNNWTPTNLSVTAGAGNDSLVDTPTNYGTDTGVGAEVRSNYCTWNAVDKDADVSLTNGNLDMSQSAAGSTLATIGVSSGKWYWEVTAGTGSIVIGAVKGQSGYDLSNYVGATGASIGYNFNLGGIGDYLVSNVTLTGSGLNTYTSGDIIGVALDMDAGTIKFYKNGVLQGRFGTGLTGTWFPAIGSNVSTGTSNANFGQRPFAYTAPSGFKALCTANLPTPTIANPATAMDVVLYTGTGATLTPTSTLGFSPDLVWIKSRSAATDNTLYDSVRGAQARLESNTTDAEVTSDNGLTAFNSNGFTLGTLAQVNTNAATYAGWAWDAGSSTVTNTSGSISSQVRASTTNGCSVVTYTGTGANATVGHGLGVAPGLVIAKRRNVASNWQVRHTSIAAANSIQLNLTDSAAAATTVWNSTAPTSTVFSIGTDATVNANTGTYVAYCFAPVVGYSAFGSWQNNGSTDGTFVYLGFRPKFILLKNTDNVERWYIMDSSRHAYNVPPADATKLQPNLADAEGTGFANTATIDFLSNGFKIRTTNPAAGEISFGTRNYIYAAFAEHPFSASRAR